ncbi:MAG: Linear gramicidin synthase subunit D [Firmicutes bacterium ADurb.Bin419]|nr:MAG: Linear gramicidin synthase subunit D [Firmicutes bacterium ADurb.Bin419]
MKIPVSYHQERIWFIDQFERGSLYENGPVYHNIPLVVEIKGELDISLLQKSICCVINRHEALKTIIVKEEDKIYQQVAADNGFLLDIVQMPEGMGNYNEMLNYALDFVKNSYKDGIDGALIKGKLMKADNSHHFLVLSIHHLICDKKSLEIIAREISACYEAYSKGSEPRLEDLELHYGDFSDWQNNLPAEIMESLYMFWRRKLSGKLQALELSTDNPRAPIHVYNEGRYCFELNEELFEKVDRFCVSRGISQRDLLLAVFKVLLYRYSGLEEIVVGTSMENRIQEELENVVGPIANLVVLRSFIKDTQNFIDVSDNVSAYINEAKEYSSIPFDKLVLELNPENDMSRTALFDVLFQYEQDKQDLFEMKEGQWKIIDTNLGWGKYDLNLLIKKMERSYSCIMTYNSDYYNSSTIERMMNHFIILCNKLLDNPMLEVSKVSFLSHKEETMLLDELNDTDTQYPKGKCIHDFFTDQCRKTPDNVAIKFNHETITYRELNEKTNGLARLIRSKGVGRNNIVGMVLERSPYMIIAMISVLKAGGAYLPIDPQYPEDRINYLIEDSGAQIILTTEDLKEKCSFAEQIICIDSIDEDVDCGDLESINTPDDMAYIIYTSGTTGNPKGVIIEHRNIARLMFNDNFQFDFDHSDVWTMFHSYNFDFSVWEMYGALLYGGRLVIVAKMIARDTKSFLELLRKEGVTVLNQTPPAFYNLINEEFSVGNSGVSYDSPLKLRYIIFGGEALNPCKLKHWKNRYPETKLINMYGITETTVHVTYKEITDKEIESNVSNIGKPLPTLTTYIMDRNMGLQPLGVAGELLVGGDGVGRGYLNREELTKEKFIWNPYKPSERLYRSGDLVRYLENGEMEYLGRIDHQVKIRGFRIELGEIESVLVKYSEIKEAVVIGKKDSSQDSSLVAYVVWNEYGRRDINALRTYLKGALPEYMVPSFFVNMDCLPLTSNGKVDRKNLPEPDKAQNTSGEVYVEPSSEIEKAIFEIWKEVLKVEKIGINDNFFNIGGNSLLVTKIVYKFNEKFKLNLTFPYFFTSPTISAMARFVESQSEKVDATNNKNFDFREEVVFDQNIKFDLTFHKANFKVKNILLTGATGFLGAFLLKDLLEETSGFVYCLVRAKTIDEVMERIQNNLEYYSLWKDEMKERIIPLPGDLEMPLFGLSESEFIELSDNIDIIYHNGAVARYIYPYERLKKANVSGTHEIIKLASMRKIKPIHYISTVSVFNFTKKKLIYEGDLPEKPEKIESEGYSQSKWVAEELLRKASAKGIPVSIYRPGRICGDSITGACQTNDFLWQVIQTCIEIQGVFDCKMEFDMAPVNYVSKCIVKISKNLQNIGQNYHLYNPHRISMENIKVWIGSLGYSMDVLPYKEWYCKVKNVAENHQYSMAAKLLPALAEDMPEESILVTFDDQNTRKAIESFIIPDRNIDESVFKRNFRFLEEKEFIKLGNTRN